MIPVIPCGLSAFLSFLCRRLPARLKRKVKNAVIPAARTTNRKPDVIPMSFRTVMREILTSARRERRPTPNISDEEAKACIKRRSRGTSSFFLSDSGSGDDLPEYSIYPKMIFFPPVTVKKSRTASGTRRSIKDAGIRISRIWSPRKKNLKSTEQMTGMINVKNEKQNDIKKRLAADNL